MIFLLISVLILTAFHIADLLTDGDEGWKRTVKPNPRGDFSNRARGGGQKKTNVPKPSSSLTGRG